jgi:hypothetical protein
MLGEVLTAMVTPFREDGTIDYDRFRELAQHLVIGGCNLVEVAVGAHERQQLGEVSFGDALDRQGESSSRSSPIVRPGGRVAS